MPLKPETDAALRSRLETSYQQEKAGFLGRLRRSGWSLEEAEDLVHDLFVESLDRLPLVAEVRNLGGWLNNLFQRRVIDSWRHRQVQVAKGEVDVAEETLQEIMVSAGLDPLDEFVRGELVEALNDALAALPEPQRQVLEAQVFGGMTFRELAESTGQSIDTLMARKRYALKHLGQALRDWMEEP